MIRIFDLILDFSEETHTKRVFYGCLAYSKAWYLSVSTNQHEMRGFDW